MSENIKYSFVCPSCGKNTGIMKQTSNVIFIREISCFQKIGLLFFCNSVEETEEFDYSNAETDFYKCSGCGEILKDNDGEIIDNDNSLIEWLTSKGFIKMD